MTAVYFSGFGFANESALFGAPSAVRECLDMREYDVVGFSYGAQKAVRYALHSTRPIRRLSLLSPAFFHSMPTRRKEAEIRLFAANPTRYLQGFLQQALSGATDASEAQRELALPYFCLAAPESIRTKVLESDLRALLFYTFCADELAQIRERGIEIEVFLGEKDRIVSAAEARDFFAPLATRLFWVQGVGHLLLS